MNMRRIIFVGKSRRELLCQQISSFLISWLESWSFTSDHQVVVSVIDKSELILPESRFVFKSKFETSFWLDANSVRWETLLWNESLPRFPLDRTGKRIIEDAVVALRLGLMRSLTRENSGKVLTDEESCFDSDDSIGDRNLGFDILIGDQRLFFVVTVGEWLDVYSRKISGVVLKSTYDALSKHKSSFAVNLDLGRFEIATIKNLARGDVLISDVPLSSLFKLQLNEKHSLDVYLGKAGDQKAIQLQ